MPGKQSAARALLLKVIRFRADECGQVLPLLALAMVCLLGISGVAVDTGRCLYIYRQLQAATDAAALAGAGTLPNSTAATVAAKYSAVTTDQNARPSLTGATMVSGYPKVECLNTLKAEGMACASPGNGNAIIVKEQITVPLYFLRVVGIRTITLGTSASASISGGAPTPYNVAIILDTTLSMNQLDSDCGYTQMVCALNGVQTLLQSLSPCAINTTCSVYNGISTNSVDRVSLFTFPNITVGTAGIDYSCTTGIPSPTQQNGYFYNSAYGNYSLQTSRAWSGVPSSTSYTFPTAGASNYSPSGTNTGTYQVTGFLSDYKTSDAATTLNTSSTLVQAAGGVAGCNPMTVPNYAGDYGTYYAGAMYAAQAALMAQSTANPGTQNVIILLSDGDANSPSSFTTNGTTVSPMGSSGGSGSYPSYVNECAQGINAAAAASAAGTLVYTVAYGSPTIGCSTDTFGAYAGISPCTALADMATAPQYFFSDYKQSGASNSYCYAPSQSVTSLNDIFHQIANALTTPRLIPDSVT